jgi:hypothetical protein
MKNDMAKENGMKRIILLTVMVSVSLFILGCAVKKSSDRIDVPDDPITEPAVYTGAGYAFNNKFLEAFPWDKYGDYTPMIFRSKTNVLLVSSKAEAEELFGEAYSYAYAKEGGIIKNTLFQDVISKYHEDYFENHQLLTFYLTTGASENWYKLESVDYKDGVLTVIFNYYLLGGLYMLEYWFTIVEIERIPEETRIDIKVERNGKFEDTDLRFYMYPRYNTLTP